MKYMDGSSAFQNVIDTNLPISRISHGSVIQKFLDLSSSLFESKQAEKVIRTVENLEDLKNVRQLTKLLVSDRLAP